MTRYLKRSIYFLLYITCLTILIPQTTYANEDASSIGYSYKIIKPENQVGNAGYFDLRMNPEQKQIVDIELYNMTDQDLSVDLSVHSAKTNSNGVIEYGPTKLKNDPSLKYDLKDIVKVPEKVTIPPKVTQKVAVEISMPQEKYDGYISGGIYLQKSETEAEKKASESAQGVVNKYAFIVGMLLSESDTKVQPELSFNKIYAGLTNYRNTFLVDFTNTEATYVEGMTVDAQIFKKGSDDVLYETKKENYRMAPNSAMSFPINLNGESFIAGDYVGRIRVTAGDKKWEWQEEFKITQKDADKYNAEDVSLIQDRGINWKMILMIAGGILVIFLLIYLVTRAVSNKQKKKRKKTKKKR
ncbi:DUF916 and DUF3324 domain-containing protein [Enterococcus caccae]|uniref:Uncharacterized protein n=1 Tax=Enterococcus caccae ATCC BAA-1240 TaxID=1158612 RepID=R3WQ35_9ENTE|nr:DUF916 and DUF3324 domain-containing protein [Enterococcus caccae]EOL49941.1 hypothetical protein UC7_00606 [Enterococcus caccae ATCC BAA-1240]EOT56281.1 hypothetical protein I580_03081 [Enterococcus caccae ATCC BAA-1240]OJG26539.1 hypothetical protein RU98_GL000595 [Enterococcus caccae]